MTPSPMPPPPVEPTIEEAAALRALMASMGGLAVEGRGRDLARQGKDRAALACFGLAASHGARSAGAEIARRLEWGEGAAPDLAAAHAWHLWAVGGGDLAPVEAFLGFLERRLAGAGDDDGEDGGGDGAPTVNPAMLTAWRRRAAELGGVEAMFSLSVDLFDAGNEQEAFHWLNAAAGFGFARAQLCLGLSLVEDDPETARLWLNRAAAGLEMARRVLRTYFPETPAAVAPLAAMAATDARRFADLARLDDRTLQALIRRTDKEILVAALQTTQAAGDVDVRLRLRENMSVSAWTILVSDIVASPPVAAEIAAAARRWILAALCEDGDAQAPRGLDRFTDGAVHR